MNRSDWGIKRICLGCSTRFYDFNKSPIVCPACNVVFDPEYLSKRKTKTSQEKSEDIENLRIDIEFDDVPEDSDEDIVNIDDGDDISLDDEKA